MQRFRPSHRFATTRRATVLAVVLGAGLLLAPRMLQAGCGDYVFVRDASGRLVRASQLHGACHGPFCHPNQKVAPLPPPNSAPLSVPCDGPECSGRDNAPPASPPTPTSIRIHHESAILADFLGEDLASRGWRQVSFQGEAAVRRPQFVFRPPR